MLNVLFDRRIQRNTPSQLAMRTLRQGVVLRHGLLQDVLLTQIDADFDTLANGCGLRLVA